MKKTLISLIAVAFAFVLGTAAQAAKHEGPNAAPAAADGKKADGKKKATAKKKVTKKAGKKTKGDGKKSEGKGDGKKSDNGKK